MKKKITLITLLFFSFITNLFANMENRLPGLLQQFKVQEWGKK